MRRHDRMRNSQSHEESRMSATSEEVPANSNSATDPLDTLSSLTRRSSERAEPRLAAVSERPMPRMPRTDLRTDLRFDALRPMPAQGDRLETAMSEFVQRQLRPEAVPEPAGLKRDARRRMMLAGAVTVAIASLVALIIVILFPREKDIIQSFAAAVPAAPAQSLSSELAAAPSRTLLGEGAGGESFNHEQSEQLLQQFVQWRQNLALTAKP
jgi:hypothetical protein